MRNRSSLFAMRLSFEELRQQSEAVVLTDILQGIQGGSNEDCHVAYTDDDGLEVVIKNGVVIRTQL